jgi:nucleotide-binding universal stress UspA family protein
MFKTIAFGLDGSDGARRALPFAARLAELEGARLIIIHVEEGIVGKGGGPVVPNEEEVQAEVRRQADELASKGLDVTVKMTSVMVGGPAPAIAKVADEDGADLIIVGSRGHSAIVGVLLGSVAQRLTHLANQPVLVIPEQASLQGDASADSEVGAGASQ